MPASVCIPYLPYPSQIFPGAEEPCRDRCHPWFETGTGWRRKRKCLWTAPKRSAPSGAGRHRTCTHPATSFPKWPAPSRQPHCCRYRMQRHDLISKSPRPIKLCWLPQRIYPCSGISFRQTLPPGAQPHPHILYRTKSG